MPLKNACTQNVYFIERTAWSDTKPATWEVRPGRETERERERETRFKAAYSRLRIRSETLCRETGKLNLPTVGHLVSGLTTPAIPGAACLIVLLSGLTT
jgi:hypothetical protein